MPRYKEYASDPTDHATNTHEVKSDSQANVPFIPIQHWFADLNLEHPNHFNQAMMLEKKTKFKIQYIKNIFNRLLKHHDALRAVWCTPDRHLKIQSVDEFELNFEFIDISHLPEDKIETEIDTQATKRHSGIDLENGPLWNLSLFRAATGDYLLIILHHLIVDGVSWRILIQDFISLYTQLDQGNMISVAQKTFTIKDWQGSLVRYAQSEVLQELSYWRDICQNHKPIFSLQDKRHAQTASKSQAFSLSKEETRILLRKVNKKYQSRINDILLTALAKAFAECLGSDHLVINLEGHGREMITPDIDLTRTIGWFTSQFPVCLTIENKSSLYEQIETTKKIFQKIPQNGIGYGILRYLSDIDPQIRKELAIDTEVTFNYLGQFNSSTSNDPIQLSSLPTGNPIHNANLLPDKMSFSGWVKNDQMNFGVTYKTEFISDAQAKALTESLKHQLQTIIRSCSDSSNARWPSPHSTPQERDRARINARTKKQGSNGQLEPLAGSNNIAPLTPIQKDIFRGLALTPNSGYDQQRAFDIHQEIKLQKIIKATRYLAQKHDILRMRIFCQDLSQPYLVTNDRFDCIPSYFDLSTLETTERDRAYQTLMQEQKDKGCLEDCPLDITIVKLESCLYRVLFSFYSVLVDTHSLNTIFSHLWEIYQDRLYEKCSVLDRMPLGFIRYSKWLEQKDPELAKLFWQYYLDSSSKHDQPRIKKTDTYEHFHSLLNQETYYSIEQSAIGLHLSTSDIFQSAWALVLYSRHKSADRVYGLRISTKCKDLDGIDETLGVFENTVPIRIVLKNQQPFTDLARTIHRDRSFIDQYGYLSLNEIKSEYSGATCFDTVYIHSNALPPHIEPVCIPVEQPANEPMTKTPFPLDLEIICNDNISFDITYNTASYTHSDIEKLYSRFINTLELWLKDPGICIDIALEPIPLKFTSPGQQKDQTEIRDTLFKLWKDCLKKSEIKGNDDFFESGGDSLAATEMIAEINRLFAIDLSLSDFFDNPTINVLTNVIASAKKAEKLTIEPVKPSSHYIAGAAQKRLYAIHQSGDTTYNMPRVLKLSGQIDKGRIHKVINALVDRHEAFRTFFKVINGEISQIVQDRVKIDIESGSCLHKDIQKCIQSFIRPFNLESAPLLRVGLFTLSDRKDQYLLILDMHHSIADGESAQILIKEFMVLYQGNTLLPLSFQFKEFAHWQAKLSQTDLYQKRREFWLSQFRNSLPSLNLPTDFTRPSVQTFKGSRLAFQLSKRSSRQLSDLARAMNVTLYMLVLSIFKILISKYAQQNDIIVGTPASGRQHSEFRGIIGMFVNTLALHSQPDGEKSFPQYVKEIKSLTIRAFENQDYQFDDLIQELQIKRDPSRNPLFDVMFVWHNFQDSQNSQQKLDDLTLETIDPDFSISRFDLTLVAAEKDEKLSCSIEYSTTLFNKDRIKRLANHFKSICDQLISRPHLRLKEIELCTPRERSQILETFNDTVESFQDNLFMADLFEQQVEQNPDHPALIADSEQIDYKTLNQKSNQLAHHLRDQGIERGAFVAILMNRSIDLIVSLLAVMKAGAAFMPLDPSFPKERIRYQLADSRCKWLITTSETNSGFGIEHCIDADQDYTHFSDQNPERISLQDDIAYVIYTSGSTGRPKGVLIKNHNIINTLCWRLKEFNSSTSDRSLQILSHVFDGFIASLFTPLFSGTTSYIPSEENCKNAEYLANLIYKEKITLLLMVPSLYEMILNHMDKHDYALQCVTLAGEALKPELVIKSKQKLPQTEITNEYGPTENSIASTGQRDIRAGEPITIGRPISNTLAFIVDSNGLLLPVGVPGELWLAGKGIAPGYLNNPQLTSEKFLPNPFGPGKVYKTGDLACWTKDGRLKFLGRLDHQVKINGVRIECDEIESILAQHPKVEKALISLYHPENTPVLIGYYSGQGAIDSAKLKAFMSTHLPQNMIPALFIYLPEFPLASTGKIDRKALPDPEALNSEQDCEPPTETEQELILLWKSVLDKQPTSVHSNFFALGGHSLKAIQVISLLKKTFKVEMSLNDFFAFPTIREQADVIRSLERSKVFAIQPVTKRDLYAVSAAQKRLYTLYKKSPEPAIVYNIPLLFEIKGTPDRGKLLKAFQEVIHNHNVFRTSFVMQNGEIYQRIANNVNFTLETTIAQGSEIQDLFKSFIAPFDLGKAPLLRGRLVTLSDKTDTHYLFIDMHHIISDGESMRIILNDLIDAYQDIPLKQANVHYKDYAAWQAGNTNSQAYKEHESYWLSQYDSEIPVLNFPTDFNRPAVQSFEGAEIHFSISKSLSGRIEKFAQARGMTPFMMIYAVYSILLAKYSGQEDVVIGSPIAGRNHPDLKDIVGMFVNTLALYCQPKPEKSIDDYLEHIKDITLSAFEHQDYQFDELVDKLHIERNTSRNPLFDVLLSWETLSGLDTDSYRTKDFVLSPKSTDLGLVKFDFSLTGNKVDEKFTFTLRYCTRLFRSQTMERLAEHFKYLLAQFVENPDQKIKDLALLSEKKLDRLISQFNNTQVDYPRQKTVHELFEEKADKNPGEIALISDQQELCYDDLNQKANGLAKLLNEQGIDHEDLVGIYLERSIDMVIAMLAILKSGAAFLPLDTALPKERLNFILCDSNCQTVLSVDSLHENLPQNISYIGIQSGPVDVNHRPNRDGCADDLAYVMYTSGSTGKPKGVMIEHRNILRLVKNTNIIPLTKETTILATSSAVFDVIIFEVWGTLLNGGKVVLVDNDTILDAKSLKKAINDYNVNTLDITSALFSQLVDQDVSLFDNLRYLITGGDVVSAKHAQKLRRVNKDITIVNAYGPTENCVTSTCYHLPQDIGHDLPIGKPAHNNLAYIVDKTGRLLPPGIPGELVVGGDGVARGYMNRPGLTVQKFRPNPFGPGRVYYTGDMARWRYNGEIEFLGRQDNQIKLRGYRIECAEVKAAIIAHVPVRECLVMTVGKGVEKSLCCYFIAEQPLNSSDIQSSLSHTLPDYMIPTHFIQIDEFPLTINGKIDKKALPNPTGSSANVLVAPATLTEARLVEIWKNLLGLEHVSIDANFFSLGGHSLKAMTLVALVNQTFNIDLPAGIIFRKATIHELADEIDKSDLKISKIEPVDNRPFYPASFAQQRLVALSEANHQPSVTYNVPIFFRWDGPLNKPQLQLAFNKLLERHEILRTSFEVKDGQIVQIVHDQVRLSLNNVQSIEADVKNRITNFVQPFDLSRAPLMRAAIIDLVDQPASTILMLDFHHSICDGKSEEILIEELRALYHNETLPNITLHYKDFAVWQHQRVQRGELEKQKAAWLSQFSDELPVLELPKDYPRPTQQSSKGDRLTFSLNRNETHKLQHMAAEQNVTLYMLCMAIFKITLARLSQQQDLVIGTPSDGRHHAQAKNMVGMFVNTLAIRSQPKAEKTFQDYLDELKTILISCFENQDYQFDQLVNDLELARDPSRNPLFDVMFAWQNLTESDTKTKKCDDVTLVPFSTELSMAKFDLGLIGYDQADQLDFMIEYCADLFTQQRMQAFKIHFLVILGQILANPQTKIKDLKIVSEQEETQILQTFNDTTQNIPYHKSLVDLFEEQVKKSPNGLALVTTETLHYNELNQRANRLAHKLIDRGVRKGDLVAILLHKSTELAVSILAALKAGAVFMPMDPDMPQARIHYQLLDSGSNWLVTDKGSGIAIDFSGSIIDVAEDIESYSNQNPVRRTDPSDICYSIYTSGSTGKPKGVLIENSSISNTILYRINEYQLSENDFVLQVHSHIFDGFLVSFFTPLLSGAPMVMPDKNESKNPEILASLLTTYKITYFNLIPALYDQTLNHIQTDEKLVLKYVTLGGEELKPDLVAKSKKILPDTEIINEYGPTENSVSTTIQRNITIDDPITIGHPLPNMNCYVVDNCGQLSPIGVPGELWISGIGLAPGYLNRPELTHQAFADNPFGPGKVYKSGDVVAWTHKGNLEYLGRMDNQIKINGYRIECGEIEATLSGHPDIQMAVVLLKQIKCTRQLLAYYTGKESINDNELRHFLEKRLPPPMIPNAFIYVEQFPLSAAGKIDRTALPEPNQGPVEQDPMPQTATQVRLIELWQKVLEQSDISVQDQFFNKGGHSLKAINLLSQINKHFKVTLELSDLFSNPVLRDQARLIDESENSQFFSIIPVESKEVYPVSSSQKRLYALFQFSDTPSISYNVPQAYLIEGHIDFERLKTAFQKLVDRHESFRTSFEIQDEEIIARVHKHIEFTLKKSSCTRAQLDDTIKAFIKPFDLNIAPLLRAVLVEIKDQPDHACLIMDMHHIIADGESIKTILRDLIDLYKDNPLSPLALQYKDYAYWQYRKAREGLYEKLERFWLDQFPGNMPVLELLTDYSRPAIQDTRGSTLAFSLDEKTSDKLKAFARAQGITLYMAALTFFKVLLAKYSGQKDIVVGTPVAGRRHADLENMVGMFVNTLALRTYPEPDKSIQEYIREIKKVSLEAFEHQDYPFDELVEKLEIERDMSRNPLFDVMFSWQYSNDKSSLLFNHEDFTLSPASIKTDLSNFDIGLFGAERKDCISFVWNYSTALFRESTIQRMTNHFITLITQGITDPDKKLANISLLSAPQQKQILDTFNNTQVDYPGEKSVQEIFREQVKSHNNKIALNSEGEQLTFDQLEERSNSLAQLLLDQGVQQGDLVGLYSERGVEMVIAMLAILKTGAAFLPLDTEYPKNRLEFILKDSHCKIVLAEKERTRQLPDNINVIDIRSGTVPNTVFDRTSGPDHLAYVMYTSGSTGRPKGVMIEHRNIVRLVKNTDIIHLDTETKILATSAAVFDVIIFEVFGALLNGGELVLVDNATILNIDALKEALKRYRINVLDITSALFSQLVDEDCAVFNGLQYLLTGGDVVSAKHAKKLRQHNKDLVIVNAYGPTENCVTSTRYHIPDSVPDRLPIGTPIHNSFVYILDSRGHLQPVGLSGELVVGGDGVGRGYMNRPELTAEKFVSDPFKGGRMYRTGDLARWKEDGTIEFLGRIDNQLKLRGFRIECGEIEHAVKKSIQVKECLVSLHGEGTEKALCCYYTHDTEIDPLRIRSELATILPEYMIPSYFIHLEQFPLTINGKIDRKALPQPSKEKNKQSFQAPRTEIEKLFASIWRQVLNVDQIGVDDNFFYLGGDSINAILVVSKLAEYHCHIKVPDIVKYPTITELADYVCQKQIDSQERVTGRYPASPSQRNLLTLSAERLKSRITTMVISKKGKIDTAGLYKVLARLLEHHDCLRTILTLPGKSVFYKPTQPVSDILETHNLSQNGQHTLQEAISKISDEFSTELNLNKGPLFKTVIIHDHDRDYVLFLAHQIIMDGESWDILYKDFVTLYHQIEKNQDLILPLKSLSFAKWNEFLMAYQQSDSFKEETALWESLEKKMLVPSTSANDNNQEKMDLTLTESDNLEDLSRLTFNASPDNFFAVLTGIALNECLERDESTIAMIKNVRSDFQQMNLSRTIGSFTSTVPMTIKKQDNKPLEKEIEEALAMQSDISHGGSGYSLYRQETETEQIHKFLVGFQFNGKAGKSNSDPDFGIESIHNAGLNEKARKRYALFLTFDTTKDQIQIRIEYEKAHFSEQKLEKFSRILKRIIADLLEEDGECKAKKRDSMTIIDEEELRAINSIFE